MKIDHKFSKLKIFVDEANPGMIDKWFIHPWIHGATTNQTLILKHFQTNVNAKDYERYVKDIIMVSIDHDKPVSIPLLMEDYQDIKGEVAHIRNLVPPEAKIFFKVPVCNRRGNFNTRIIKYLLDCEVRLNVTCLFTTSQLDQLQDVFEWAHPDAESIWSVFAGRLADTLRGPPFPTYRKPKNVKLLWASTRELWNIKEAEYFRFDIITVPPAILAKIDRVNKAARQMNIETVKMFMDSGNEIIEKFKWKK